MKHIFLFISVAIVSVLNSYSQDIYYPYVDSTAVWYVKKEVRLKEDPEGSIFSDETFVSYEKHYYRIDTIIDGVQFYTACVEFSGLDTVLELGLSYEIDSVVYAVESVERRDESVIQEDFTSPTQEIINAEGYLLSEYKSVSDEYKRYEAIGYGLGFTSLVNGFTFYYDGTQIQWSINDYHLKETQCLCYEREGNIIYKSSPDVDCWPLSTDIELEKIIGREIVKSPIKGSALIPASEYRSIKLISLFGNVVEYESLKNTDLYQINTDRYAPGIYFLVVNTNDNKILYQKIQIK